MTVGPNINITKSSVNNAEECIAINPVNPANLFAADTWFGAVRYTLDGGTTWNDSNVSALPASNGDVSAVFDAFGNLFLVELTTSSAAGAVALSTNGGASFRLLYTTAASIDQPTVVTGPSSTPGPGSVWINYTPSSGVAAAQGASVTGLGAVGAFGPVELTTPQGDFGDIAVGPAGQVMIAHQNENSGGGPDTIQINVDADGLGPGALGPAINATATQVGGFAYIPAQPQRSIDAEAGLAWDCSGGPHNGRVYLVYTDRPSTTSNDTDIYVRYSDNNGSTWSSSVRVNDDPIGNGKSQFLPRIALDQTTGYIAVSFYDCRNSAANNTPEVWASVSTDGGQTFLHNVKVSAGVSSALVTAIANTGFDFGDYTGLAFHAGSFYPCWADNSNSTGDNPAGAGGNFDIYTARVTVHPAFVMSNLTAATWMNQPLRISAAKILLLCSDPDGEALSLSAVSPLSTNGASLSLNSGIITYTPAANFVDNDRFTYWVSDPAGETAPAYVFVNVRPLNLQSLNMLPPAPIAGGYQVSFLGVPGYSYTLQRAASPTGPWTTLASVTTDVNGLGTFADTNPLGGSAFYRTTYP